MNKSPLRRAITALASSLLVATAAASAPAVAAPPACDNPSFCEWDFECFYVGPDGNIVWSCRLIKRCYC